MHRYASGLRYLPWYPIAGASDDPPASDPPASPPTSGAKTDPPASDDKRFTQAELDAIVRDRLDRERKKADETARKAAEDAEARKLAEQQEWQKLAGTHEARVKELEPQAQRAERYETALRAHLETQRKDLPAHITELLDKMDVAEQLEWLAKHRAELVKAPAGTSGVPATPVANGTPTPQAAIDEAAKKLQATGNYRPGVF